jgi:hypothetical protein
MSASIHRESGRFIAGNRGTSRSDIAFRGSPQGRAGQREQSAYWLELLVEAQIVAGGKLDALRKEADELTAIFVTILKTSKAPSNS